MRDCRKMILCLCLLGILLVGSIVFAQSGYPQYTDLYVNDYAGLLSADTAGLIRNLLVQLKTDTGIEAVVVTINSIHDYGTGDSSVPAFATNLFNSWGIGSTGQIKNSGVLILVAVQDREVRIEVGAGSEGRYNTGMQNVIDENMLPYFRQGDYSQGIYNGVRGVVYVLTGSWPANTQPSGAAARPQSAQAGTDSNVSPVILGGGALAVFGAAAVGLREYQRRKPRKCAHCGTQMIRLDEYRDDEYLNAGQQREESLQSVDYDVWLCPNCGRHQTHRYRALFSGYGTCPSCSYRTLRSASHVVTPATYSSSGLRRITQSCQNCGHHDERTVIIPMLTQSDSSSSDSGSSGGSSFSGGSSSGDGASGHW